MLPGCSRDWSKYQSSEYQFSVSGKNEPIWRISSIHIVIVRIGFDSILAETCGPPFISHDTCQNATLNQGLGWGALATANPVQAATISGAVASLDNSDPNRSGLGDLYLGFKKRIVGDHNRASFRLALGGGFRAPTGHVADPLNGSDASTGDGQWDLSFWTWTDYQFTDHFFINLLTRHDYGLSAHRQAAFPNDVTQATKIKFQPGILHHLQLEPQYRLAFDTWDLLPGMMFTYDYQSKEKRQAFDLSQSEFVGSMGKIDGTDWQRFMIKPMVGVRLFKQGVPAQFYLSYGHSISSKNSVDIKTVELRMDCFFKGIVE